MEANLITGIIIAAIGIILYCLRGALPEAVNKLFYVLGIILIVVGAIVITYAILVITAIIP